MNLSDAALETLRNHWAVSAVGDDLERAENLVDKLKAHRAVGEQLAFDLAQDGSDISFLERIALAYEMAAIEGLDELSRPEGRDCKLREQAVAASYRAFDIRSLMPVPEEQNARLFFVLQLSVLAYCGDRWPDLKRWYRENDKALDVPDVNDSLWDQRLLIRIFDCWTSLFRKQGWDDLNRISGIIAELRKEQAQFEADRLNNGSQVEDRAVAFRLVALYHWAKGTELLANYVLKGADENPFAGLDKHFEAAINAAVASSDSRHELILRWLHAASQAMISNSLWWAVRSVNSKTSEFVRSLTNRGHQSMFELLPPQRKALLEQGLLDQAKTAVVIDMPTSGGKTLLAQFRILQALNQFKDQGGWVAYVTPTRALSAQITRRLRKDFTPIGLRVEQLTAAVEIDAFEEKLLNDKQRQLDVLVATPEKLSLVIRNKRFATPPVLLVMDEAHNIEDEERGLRIELLLAIVKRDCPKANFLLMMPYVDSTEEIAQWLAQSAEAGQTISLGTMPWKPNERIVGLYRAVANDSERSGWHLEFETLVNTPKAMPLSGTYRAGEVKPLKIPKSSVLEGEAQKQKGLIFQTAAMAKIMSKRGTSIAIANSPDRAWKMAKQAADNLSAYTSVPDDIKLVQDFLRSEVGSDFQLVELLEHGVGVHHAGLSDETRSLLEWLAENGNLRMLCATTTIAQGLNFPVSSVFLQTYQYPYGKSMSPREFWNLAGRAGRLDHDSVGVVGLAEGDKRESIMSFVSQSTGELVSRLVILLDEMASSGELSQLSGMLWKDQWEDFRCYVSHLWAEKENLDAVLADTEQLLRQTYGYTTLRNNPEQRKKADALLEAAKTYAHKLAENPGYAKLADATGFSPEGVGKAMAEMNQLENRLTTSDWQPDSLFGSDSKMADLFGVMLKVPQLKNSLKDFTKDGFSSTQLSDITSAWVNGTSIKEIAQKYFRDGNTELTDAITNAYRAINRAIINSGTWGMSALSNMSIDFDKLDKDEKRRINALPAMIYHGVRTEDAVLMRMNSAPRSAAEALGELYREFMKGRSEDRFSVGEAREFLKGLRTKDWEGVRPQAAELSGDGYKRVWEILSGELEASSSGTTVSRT